MIPLSDPQLVRRNAPVVTWVIIGVNVLVFFYELSLGRRLDNFFLAYGAIPFELVTGRDIPPLIPYPVWVTAFTSMFMHGGWFHIGGNMLYLWVFSDNIEDALGKGKFIVFYLASGIVALGAQVLVGPDSRIPTIGASGAIAGVLGAYLVLYPRSMITTLVFFGYFIRPVPIPALFYLGFWFIMQIFSGVASFEGGAEMGGVAYFAHLGGFGAGVGLIFLFGGRRLARPRITPPSTPALSEDEEEGVW